MSRAQVGDSDAFGERPSRTVEVFTRGEGISVGGPSRTNAHIIGAGPDNLCRSPKVGLSWAWRPKSPIRAHWYTVAWDVVMYARELAIGATSDPQRSAIFGAG